MPFGLRLTNNSEGRCISRGRAPPVAFTTCESLIFFINVPWRSRFTYRCFGTSSHIVDRRLEDHDMYGHESSILSFLLQTFGPFRTYWVPVSGADQMLTIYVRHKEHKDLTAMYPPVSINLASISSGSGCSTVTQWASSKVCQSMIIKFRTVRPGDAVGVLAAIQRIVRPRSVEILPFSYSTSS